MLAAVLLLAQVSTESPASLLIRLQELHGPDAPSVAVYLAGGGKITGSVVRITSTTDGDAVVLDGGAETSVIDIDSIVAVTVPDSAKVPWPRPPTPATRAELQKRAEEAARAANEASGGSLVVSLDWKGVKDNLPSPPFAEAILQLEIALKRVAKSEAHRVRFAKTVKRVTLSSGKPGVTLDKDVLAIGLDPLAANPSALAIELVLREEL